MKFFLLIVMSWILIVGCKNKQETVNKVPNHLQQDPIRSIQVNKNHIDKGNVDTDEDMTEKEINRKNEEGEYENHILEGNEELDVYTYRYVPVSTKRDVAALIAFETFLTGQKYSLDRFNTLLYIDIDNDGSQEILMEYSVKLDFFSGSSTWSLQFLVGKLHNEKMVPIIHDTLGGKGYRTISFDKLDGEGNFNFKKVTYREKDAMCCPTLNGETFYSLRQEKFVELKR